MLTSLILLVSLFGANPSYAQDTYVKDVYDLLGLNTDGTSAVTKLIDENSVKMKASEAIGTDGKIKGDYLAAVINCAGADLYKCKEEPLKKAVAALEYDARQKYSKQIIQKYYTQIKDVVKNSSDYGKSAGLTVGNDDYKFSKKLIEARADLAKDEFEYLNAKASGKTIDETALKAKIDGTRKTFESKLTELKSATFDNDAPTKEETADATKRQNKSRGLILDALKDAEDDLAVTADKVDVADIYNTIPEGLEICKDYDKMSAENKAKCEKMAAEYLKAAASGGSVWKPIKVTNDKNCDMFDRLGSDGWNTLLGFVSTYKTLKFQECTDDYGSGDEKCIKQGTTLKNWLGDPMNLTATYYDADTTTNDAVSSIKINPSFSTASTGTTPSLGVGGTNPYNSFLAYTQSAATGTGSPIAAGKGANNTVSAGTGAEILNNISNQYTAIGQGAGNFSSKYTPYSTNITNYNNELTSVIASATNPQIYQARANSVDKTMKQATGTGDVKYPGIAGYTNTIDLRQKISELNAQETQLGLDYAAVLAKAHSAPYRLKRGSLAERTQAAADLAMASGFEEYVKMQGKLIEGEKQLYYQNTNVIMNSNSAQNTFDISSMYASNGKVVYNRKALKLNNLKTPVGGMYALKKGWRENFARYIDQMNKKAEEAKVKMNFAKAKMQKLLAQNVPIVAVKSLPGQAGVAYEIRNMESIEAVAKKNMANIEKAMEYHRSRRLSTPPDLYAKYEQDATALKTSMQNVVAAIDQAKPNVNKSYAVLDNLYVEVPKAEALRNIAKQMVAKGL